MSDLDSGRWLRRYFPKPDAQVRLVCLPHAGGSASFYRPVAAAHSGSADVVVLQYPGRQDRYRDEFIETIDEYADAIAAVLRGQPGLPTVFFGHSMGATLGFEVAHRLESGAGRPPEALIASGRRAPGTVRDEQVHARDDEGVLRELRELNGASAALEDEEVVRMSLPAIRNDYRAVEQYPARPERSIGCALTVLVGDDDPKTTVDEALRWKEHTSGAFRLRTFAGGHFFIAPHAAAVNAEIADGLTALLGASTPG